MSVDGKRGKTMASGKNTGMDWEILRKDFAERGRKVEF